MALLRGTRCCAGWQPVSARHVLPREAFLSFANGRTRAAAAHDTPGAAALTPRPARLLTAACAWTPPVHAACRTCPEPAQRLSMRQWRQCQKLSRPLFITQRQRMQTPMRPRHSKAAGSWVHGRARRRLSPSARPLISPALSDLRSTDPCCKRCTQPQPLQWNMTVPCACACCSDICQLNRCSEHPDVCQQIIDGA